MKLVRWALAGAPAYVVYKYSIGKSFEGEDVFVSPEEREGGLSPARESASLLTRAVRRRRSR